MDSVRPARADERPDVVAMVVSAFAADPAWSHLLGADAPHTAPLFAGVLFDLRVGSGTVWVTDDIAAVSMWEPPGGPRLPRDQAGVLWDAFRAEVGEPAWARLEGYDRSVASARPATPYWYLGVLATHPDRRGEGLATAVMTPVMTEADRSGTACCLETSTTANRAFYERRGFTEVTAVEVIDGPPTWWLRRPPGKVLSG